MKLKIGDWVKSYSAGIWKIYNIISYNCLDPVKKKKKNQINVFSKRFLNNSYKKSFSEETCDPSFIKLLTNNELKKLNKFIYENQKIYNDFNNYIPKRIDSIYNARIAIPNDSNFSEIESKIPKDIMISDLDIDSFLINLGYKTNKLPSITIQFISEGFKCENGNIVYKFYKILKS